MVELIAKSPVADLLPVEAGSCRLVACAPAAITAIAPYAGAEEALSQALDSAHGLALPPAGRAAGTPGARLIWAGYRQYMLVGEIAPDAAVAAHAAVTDLSDGWVVLRLEGAGTESVLARLTPLDLDPGVFKRGHTARTELAHMMAVLTRTGEGMEIMLMRSFARWGVARIAEAMESVAAQAGLPD